jgi:hypothetical protein
VKVREFNTRVGLRITKIVGTMWSAYAFAALALISLPAALHTRNTVIIVGWVAQTFLQLVLLAVIMVGQEAQSRKVEKTILETHDIVIDEHAMTRDLINQIHQSVVTPGQWPTSQSTADSTRPSPSPLS